MKVTESYKKVHYALRPKKQVERRMLIDALLLLAESGFPVREYQYTGMGSIHFMDFTMFHKVLGIDKMLSVEISNKIKDRVTFNAPYAPLITIHCGNPIGDYICKLDKSIRHVLWLDYDDILRLEMLQDVAAAATTLTEGSVLLVTVDTEPPIKCGHREEDTEANLIISQDYFEEIAGDYIRPLDTADFKYANLPRVNIKAIQNAIKTGLTGREDVVFQPLFDFLYADGHRMLTVGGIFCKKSTSPKLKKSRLSKAVYIRFTLEEDPFVIEVPILTRKEQILLEGYMPCTDGWTPKEFELSIDEVQAFNRIYRFIPSYAEILL